MAWRVTSLDIFSFCKALFSPAIGFPAGAQQLHYLRQAAVIAKNRGCEAGANGLLHSHRL